MGRPRPSTVGALWVLFALAAADLLLLFLAAAYVPARVSGVFNEGWNALHADRALGPGLLYPDSTSLVSNNYPPLSFFLIGAVGRFVGDNIVAGRAVSLSSFVLVGFLVGVIARRLTRSALLGGFAGLCFLGHGLIHNPLYVALNDPQWLAQAVMTAALAIFVLGHARPRWRTAAIAWMLGAGLVKHTLLALPLATSLWLAWHDRSVFRSWVTTSVLGVLLIAVVLYLAFGPNLFLGVLTTPRDVRLGFMGIKLLRWIPPLLPELAACALLLVLAPRDRAARLIGLYTVLAGILGAVFLAGAGVSYNALFDLVIAAMIGAALAVGVAAERASTRGFDGAWVRTAGIALLAVPLLAAAPAAIEQARRGVASLPMREAIMANDVDYIASHPGLAFCGNPALCYWAGKSFEIDLFNSHQKWVTGVLPWSDVEALFARHHFSVLQLPRSDPRRPRPRLEEMALRHYDVDRRRPDALYLVPRREAREAPRER